MTRQAKFTGAYYRKVAVSEVDSPRLRSLSDLHNRIWCECRLGPQSHRLGLARFSVAYAAENLDRDLEVIRKAFGEVCAQLGWMYEQRWLFIPEAVPVLWDGSPKQLTGYVNEIKRSEPPPALLKAFIAITEQLGAKALDHDQSDLFPDRGAYLCPQYEYKDEHKNQDEDKNEYDDDSALGAPQSAEPAHGSTPPATILVFPTVGKSKTWDLTNAHLEELKSDFPALDVLAQCRRARGWLRDNIERRKTPRGMRKFLFGWMSREVDRGRPASHSSNGNGSGRTTGRTGSATSGKYAQPHLDGDPQ